MAQDPSGAWVAMPHPLPPPRRRRPPDAGKARKPRTSASFQNLVGDRQFIWKGMDSCARTPAVEGVGRFSPASITRPLTSQAPALTVCSLFVVPAATCLRSAWPQCAARTPAVAPHPLAAIAAPKRKGKSPRQGHVTDSGARTPNRHLRE